MSIGESDERFDDLPDEVVLKNSRWRGVLLIFAGTAMSALAVWYGQAEQAWWAPVVAVFFALGVPSGVVFIFLPGHLRLDRQGLEQRSIGVNERYDWSTTSAFGLWRQTKYGVAVSRTVVFETTQRTDMLSKAVAKLTGGSVLLASTYGMKAQQLCDLLNAFRQRALQDAVATGVPD